MVLRRRKEAVLSQLPALTEQTRYVALSEEPGARGVEYRRTAAMLVKIAERRPLSPAEQKRLQAALLKARQACNTARLCNPESKDGAPKLDELAALVGGIAQQGTSKVLVFSEWTEMLKLAAERLDAIGVGHLMLHGGVPTAARPALIERFKSDDDKTVLLSTDAGGVGLNLQVASYVVHLDLPWNPARLDQRIARAHRLGQTRGVSVTYLCAETGIERGIEGTLAGKRAVRSAATDGMSGVDALEAPSFTMFLRHAKDVLAGGLSEAVSASDEDGANERVVRRSDASDDGMDVTAGKASATTTTAAAAIAAAEPIGTDRAGAGAEATAAKPGPRGRPDMRATEAFQHASVSASLMSSSRPAFQATPCVLPTRAMAASLRARLDAPIEEGHPSLVAAVYRELLPSGAIPSTLPGVLAKIHDLSSLEEHGLPVDPTIAAGAVEDARAWLERDDAFVIQRRTSANSAVLIDAASWVHAREIASTEGGAGSSSGPRGRDAGARGGADVLKAEARPGACARRCTQGPTRRSPRWPCSTSRRTRAAEDSRGLGRVNTW